jgi:hypothetical protein
MPGKEKKPSLRADVAAAIRKAYPEHIVDMSAVYEESYFDDVCDKVRAKLSKVCGAEILYARAPQGGPRWDEGSDPDEDPPDWSEDSYSYHLFFLALRGEQYQFEGQIAGEDIPEGEDEPVLMTVPTVGRIGCSIGISLIAPFAVIQFNQMEHAETGSYTIPEIDCTIFNLDGTEVDLDEYFAELFEETGVRTLHALRDELTQILRSLGIAALPVEELRKGVPRLKADPENPLAATEGAVTVQEAFFFQCI